MIDDDHQFWSVLNLPLQQNRSNRSHSHLHSKSSWLFLLLISFLFFAFCLKRSEQIPRRFRFFAKNTTFNAVGKPDKFSGCWQILWWHKPVHPLGGWGSQFLAVLAVSRNMRSSVCMWSVHWYHLLPQAVRINSQTLAFFQKTNSTSLGKPNLVVFSDLVT